MDSTPVQNDTNCLIKSGLVSGQPCVFPFLYENRYYYACTNNIFNRTVFVCSSVGAPSKYKAGAFLNFGFCNEHCPKLEAAKSLSSESFLTYLQAWGQNTLCFRVFRQRFGQGWQNLQVSLQDQRPGRWDKLLHPGEQGRLANVDVSNIRWSIRLRHESLERLGRLSERYKDLES